MKKQIYIFTIEFVNSSYVEKFKIKGVPELLDGFLFIRKIDGSCTYLATNTIVMFSYKIGDSNE